MGATCPIHGTELVCMSCRAAHAGHAKSTRKSEASSKNLSKARLAASKARRQPDVYGKDDVIKYLKAHVGEAVTAKLLISAAPRKKKATAQLYAHQHLFHLRKAGMISLLKWGVYQINPKILQ